VTDPDAVAEPYAIVAAQSSARVREDPPADFHRWLYNAMRDVAAARGRPGDLPTVADWLGLCSLLSAAVQADEEWKTLTEWFRRPAVKPHGTMAALRRHQEAKERPCALCRAWEAGYKAGRYGARKEAA
jgi:hypothetical protein